MNPKLPFYLLLLYFKSSYKFLQLGLLVVGIGDQIGPSKVWERKQREFVREKVNGQRGGKRENLVWRHAR